MTRAVLATGLPRSGKTTFLAALWHVVSQQEIAPKLVLGKLEGSYSHLNGLRDHWLQRKEFERTKIGDQQSVKLNLKVAKSNAEFSLVFPDYSGEAFRREWRDRMCTQELATETRSAESILFFVHGDKFTQPWMLSDVLAAEGDKAEEDAAKPAVPTQWNPNKAATQVQLVELLQFLMQEPLGPRKRRISIIISAWDKVPAGTTPQGWLRARMPLLDQFVACNAESFEFGVFGVSAQGGDYKVDVARLDAFAEQSERIKVVGPAGESHDITEPLMWALDLDPVATK